MKVTCTFGVSLSLFSVAFAAPAPQNNVQAFNGNLGGAATPIIFNANADKPFTVGSDTFQNFGAAAQRSCDQQFNRCANQANGGAAFSVQQCAEQKSACSASVAQQANSF